MKTLTEYNQDIANKYLAAGLPPTSSRAMARWAIQNKLWNPSEEAMIDQCAHELAEAMREEYITDPQGRRVRAKHAARMIVDGEQMTIWNDLRVAGKEHMEIAFLNRRRQILGDCRQLKTDVDSFNDNHNSGEPVQMVLDFSRDLEEEELAAV